MCAEYKNILQWNCRGLKHNIPELQLIITETNPIAICLQEIKLNTEKFELRGYSAYHQIYSKKIACGGTSIFIKTNTPHRKININSPIQAVAIRFTLVKPLTLCSIYIPPEQTISYPQLYDLFKQLPSPIILMGDFNAHSPIWGSHDTNMRGKTIERLIDENDLCIFNDGTPTFHSSSTLKPSHLDLTMAHSTLFEIFNWHVLTNNYGSDHQPILLSTNSKISTQQPLLWNLNRADWETFQRECDRKLTENNLFIDAKERYSNFQQILLQICEQTIPKTSTKVRKNKPWFTIICKESIQNKNKQLRAFKINPSAENLKDFKIARAKTRSIIREQKRISWQNYIGKINSNTPINNIWKMIRKIKGNTNISSIQQIKMPDGKFAEMADDISNVIGQNFSNNSSSENYTNFFKTVKIEKEKENINFETNILESYNTLITLNELEQCIKETKNSAPGPDKINYEIIRHIPKLALKTLLGIYNDIWHQNTFPTEWRKAIIIPIPKENKDHTNPLNYRPISLTNCFCKIMEKIVNKRLTYFLETNNLIAKTQCGFRSNHSTIDHLVRLESFIREAFVRKEHVIAVFFDIEKAFDTTWKHGILMDLYNYGLRGNLPKFIANFLSNRTFQVKVANCLSNTFTQEEGVPQGSILSPTLFNIKINKITECLLEGTECSLYVDDFVIYYRAKCMIEVKNHLQLQLNKIQEWTDNNGFKFSAQKTKIVHFCQIQKQHLDPELYIYNEQIPVTTNVKFLGLIFDNKLSFLPHIKELKAKCQKAINLLKTLSNTDWGGEKKSLLNIYKSQIRSKLDYGCLVYGSAKTSYLKMLDPVHNQCLRLCLGAFRTTPCSSLQIEANEPSLQNRRLKLSLQYALKLKSLPNNPAYFCVFHPQERYSFANQSKFIPTFGLRIETEILKTKIEFRLIKKHSSPKTPPWLLEIPPVYLELLNIKTKGNRKDLSMNKFNEFLAKYPNYTQIYTDGSKNDIATSSVAITSYTNKKRRFNTNISINTAEAIAINQALEIVKESKYEKFIIISDSLSCLTSIKNCNIQNTSILDIMTNYQLLYEKGKTIIFCWVPGHSGIEGNEIADREAKDALLMNETTTTFPFGDAKHLLNKYIKQNFKDLTEAKINQLLYLGNLETINDIKRWNRKDEVFLCRLNTGHTRLTHSFLLKKEMAPICTACDTRLTVTHILLECKKYREIRKQYYSSGTLQELKNIRPSNIIRFMKDIQLYNEI